MYLICTENISKWQYVRAKQVILKYFSFQLFWTLRLLKQESMKDLLNFSTCWKVDCFPCTQQSEY